MLRRHSSKAFVEHTRSYSLGVGHRAKPPDGYSVRPKPHVAVTHHLLLHVTADCKTITMAKSKRKHWCAVSDVGPV